MIRQTYTNLASFPPTGTSGVIYIDLSNSNEYIYTTSYVPFTPVPADILQGHLTQLEFDAIPTIILGDGQIVWLKDNSGKFKKGDGITQLSALPFLGSQTLDEVWTKQVIQITSSLAPTVNTTGYRRTFVNITALAGNINLSTNLTGTPQNGDVLIYQIKDNGTARTIATGSNIEAKGENVPTTTVISKRVNIGFTWDSATSKWGCLSVAQES